MTVTEQERTALALAALAEVTDPAEVGDLIGVEHPEPGVVDLRFACTLAAYTGWSWVVSTADLPDQDATVLEVELLPGEGALLAPPWVPWTERLAEWRRQHPDEQHPDDEAAEEAVVDDELDEDDLAVDDDLDELDDAELDGAVAAQQDADEQDVDEQDVDEADVDEPGDDVDDDLDEDGLPPRPADEDRTP